MPKGQFINYVNTFGYVPSFTYSCSLLSWQFWQAWAALPKKYLKDNQSPGFEPNVFSLIVKSLSHLQFKMNLPKKLRI